MGAHYQLQLLIPVSPLSELRLRPPGGHGDRPQSYPSPFMTRRVSGI